MTNTANLSELKETADKLGEGLASEAPIIEQELSEKLSRMSSVGRYSKVSVGSGIGPVKGELASGTATVVVLADSNNPENQKAYVEFGVEAGPEFGLGFGPIGFEGGIIASQAQYNEYEGGSTGASLGAGVTTGFNISDDLKVSIFAGGSPTLSAQFERSISIPLDELFLPDTTPVTPTVPASTGSARITDFDNDGDTDVVIPAGYELNALDAIAEERHREESSESSTTTDTETRSSPKVVEIFNKAAETIGNGFEAIERGIGKAVDFITGKLIILDLDEDGVEIITTPNIAYDVDEDGYLEQTTWAAPDDGFLVIDREADGSRGDGDGVIDQTKEIFISEIAGDKNYTDLQALAQYDLRSSWGGNNDGKITSADDVWQNLHVWQDKNQDGNVDSNELKTLAQWDITQINLSYDDGSSFNDTKDDITIFGNTLHGLASFRMNGKTFTGGVGDVSLTHTVRGWRESRSENLIMIEIEGGENLYIKEMQSSDPSNIDLKKMNLDGIIGDERNNTLSAENVQNKEISISGGDGNDTITGSSSFDLISGDAGADELYGGGGNDLVFLDASDTVVDGGSGWDSYQKYNQIFLAL